MVEVALTSLKLTETDGRAGRQAGRQASTSKYRDAWRIQKQAGAELCQAQVKL